MRRRRWMCQLAGAPPEHLCPAEYAEVRSLMHQLKVPAVDDLLEEVWPYHRDEGTILSPKPLTDALRFVRKHLSAGQAYYVMQTRARGRPSLPRGGELSGRPAHVAALRKVAEQSASLTRVLQHDLCY